MSLNQERRLEEIFSAARKLPPQKQTVFLEGTCGTMQNCTGKRIRCSPRTTGPASSFGQPLLRRRQTRSWESPANHIIRLI